MRLDSELVRRAHGTPCLAVVQARGHKLKRSGAERIGACPRCGGRDRFSIHVRKNIWHCRRCAAGGDAISLVQHVDDVSFPEAVQIITGSRPEPVGRQAASQAASAEPSARSHVLCADSSALVARLWNEAGDPTALVKRYLESRGLTLEPELAGRLIRFHPRCPFGEGEKHPCVIARFEPIPGEAETPTAILRIALNDQAEKIGRKFLGSVAGQCIRLDANETVLEGLGLAEGLETAISVRARGWRPVWCLGSAGAIAAFPVLSGIEALTIFGDNDASGTGLRAAQECAKRWREAGREARILMPQAAGADWNDVQ